MALIIKSDRAYTGTATLKSVLDVAQTAQDYYDEYAARVVADGGTIINAAATLAAITWAKGRGVLASATAVSASWGVKVDGSNNILKIYGFNGSDFVTPSGAAANKLVTTGAYPVFQINTGAESRFLSEKVGTFTKGKAFAMVTVFKHITVASNQVTGFSINSGIQAGSFDLSVMGGPNNNAYEVYSKNSALSAQALGIGPYADYQSIGVFVDTQAASFSTLKEGAVTATGAANSGAWANLKSTTAAQVCLGQYMSGGTYYQYNAGSTFPEFWLLGDCTYTDSLALSQRMADLY